LHGGEVTTNNYKSSKCSDFYWGNAANPGTILKLIDINFVNLCERTKLILQPGFVLFINMINQAKFFYAFMWFVQHV